MEPVIEAITTEGDKKLSVIEVGKVKAEARCENDDYLPEGWKSGGTKKLVVRELGNVKDESSEEHDEDLPDGWKIKTQSLSKQALVYKLLEKVVTASPSRIIPSVSTVFYGAGDIQHNTKMGKFMEKVKDESSQDDEYLPDGWKTETGKFWKKVSEFEAVECGGPGPQAEQHRGCLQHENQASSKGGSSFS
jgi:hypothetical protein